MRGGKPQRCAPLLLAFVAAGAAAQSNEPAFSGHFSLGARSVDVDGSTTKYREDVNLDDGPRVFDAGFAFAPGGELVDRIDFDLSSLGGEPYENVRLGVRKYGAYKLELDRRRSEYFYEDTILPAALASVTGSTAGDFHQFDFERVRDTARLELTLTPATKIDVGLERFTKTGESTTTLDVERDEFELERPIDESLGTFSLGVEHAWDKLTLIAEQRVGDYENVTDLFLPGASSGANTADPAELELFVAEQPYDYESLSHAVRLLARPTARLDLQGGWRRESLELDMRVTERAAGTGFSGQPFATSLAGAAAIDRDIDLYDVEASYSFSERIGFVAAARRSELTQRGDVAFGADPGASDWRIETTGLDARVDVAVAANVVIGVGLAREERDAGYRRALGADALDEAVDTSRDGYYLSLRYDPPGPLALNASVEDDAIDDPFALAAPDRGRRYRAQGRYRFDNGIALSASYRRNDLENDRSGWQGDTAQADLRVSYDTAGLGVSAGLGQVDLSRAVDRLVAGGGRQDRFAIAYDAEATFADARARWQATPRLAVGGHGRIYENDGNYPLERRDWRAFVEVGLADAYRLEVAVRRIDYVEDGFDDFDVNLAEVAIGYRW